MAERKGFALACGRGQGAVWHPTGVSFIPHPFESLHSLKNKKHPPGVFFAFGGEEGIRTLVGLPPNGFQDFLTNPTFTQNNRKYPTIENAENPVKSRDFGVLPFQKYKTPSSTRIYASKTISKDFLEKVLDKSAPTRPVASHIISAKSAATD